MIFGREVTYVHVAFPKMFGQETPQGAGTHMKEISTPTRLSNLNSVNG